MSSHGRKRDQRTHGNAVGRKLAVEREQNRDDMSEAGRLGDALLNEGHRALVARALATSPPETDRAILEDFARWLEANPDRRLTRKQASTVAGVIYRSEVAARTGAAARPAFRLSPLPAWLRGDTSDLPKTPPRRPS